MANLVIKAIRNNDFDLMASLFNNANRRQFLPLTEEKIKTLSRLRQNELKKIADVKEDGPIEDEYSVEFGSPIYWKCNSCGCHEDESLF